MKPTALFVAALFTFAAVAAVDDPMAQERFRMKTGRNTQAEEARQKTLKNAPANAAVKAPACCRSMKNSTPTQSALHVQKCLELDKCTHMLAPEAVKSASAAPADSEARFRMKYGRSMPAQEPPTQAASAERTACQHECCKHAD